MRPLCWGLRPSRLGWIGSLPEVSMTPSTVGAAKRPASRPEASCRGARAGYARASVGTTADRRGAATEKRAVADAFARVQPPQGAHLTGPAVGLGMFGEA